MLALFSIWWAARPPVPGAFYAAPTGSIGSQGSLTRAEPFAVPDLPGVRAWRVLYATSRADGSPTGASALVLAGPKEDAGPRPVVAWAHGTTGIEPGCAPSLMRRPFANVPALAAALDRGWLIVATDYTGLGTGGSHRYLVGEDAARNVLDSVRAASRLDGAEAGNRVVVWGHSQGGHAALWTAMRAQALAPDLDLAGAGAFAPAGDLAGLIRTVGGSPFGKIVSAYLLGAWPTVYPDVDVAAWRRAGTGWLAADIASRCVGDWPTLVSLAQAFLLPADGLFARDPASGSLGARLAENTPRGPFPVPLLIAQGTVDDLVLPDVQQRFVSTLCAGGATLAYGTYPGLDHIGLVAPGSPLDADLIAWTADRFAGRPAPSTCPARAAAVNPRAQLSAAPRPRP
jgi:acetyl esterase/lipase